DVAKDKELYALKRYGKPEDVAYGIIYMLSDAAAWITGTSLVIDGLHNHLLRALQIGRKSGLLGHLEPVPLITIVEAYLEAEIRHIAEHLAVLCERHSVIARNHHCFLAELWDELLAHEGDSVLHANHPVIVQLEDV
ncbi:MAG: SDR family oxidoreductase, partial [Bacteroidales bacterium]|nr:SDR family oxidoreductase [Bacteroidales bacterium]